MRRDADLRDSSDQSKKFRQVELPMDEMSAIPKMAFCSAQLQFPDESHFGKKIDKLIDG